jgi:hypothetical protein
MQTATLFSHETVALDGELFSDCEFRDCRMIYRGGEPPKFESCRFIECDWRFEGAAAHTLDFMKGLWAVGAKAQVQAVIKSITGAAR